MIALAEIKEELSAILSQYSGEKSDLIPILHEAQERFGYLPGEVILEIARFLRMPESTVFGVATFYAEFKLTPSSRRTIKVCQGTACHVRGGTHIRREVERRLGIKPGETTDDLEYSLEEVACSGSCALAPVMEINQNVYGKMTPRKVEEILKETR